MTTRRLSKRTSAVAKRSLLEEKLERRRIEAEARAEKTRLRLSQSSTQETAESNRIVENLAENQLEENTDVEDQGNKSLEWDHSSDTPPSFINDTWDSNQAVEEIIQEILEKTSEDSDTERERKSSGQ